jgi:very-short-patch-repair endonuclease
LSLGVVAFSTAQREVILLEVERLRREHPGTEDFFQYHASGDEFFIKNLENVQGDERDVIFISVGYGRTVGGNVSQNFGPLNGKGGERRLNVLISRAKLAMQVFSNFRGDELRTDANSPFGLRALKVFLNYAEKGDLPSVSETGKEPDSPFEIEVMRAIQSLGFDVEPQVGCLGYSIDLAIVDPDSRGRYLLAVECDGASYHSSASARERDRLRQGILEGLGWRFHRIWSTEWFRNPSQEITRIKQVIERAREDQVRLDEHEALDTVLSEPKREINEPKIARAQFVEEESNRAIPLYKSVEGGALGLPAYVEDFIAIPSSKVKKAILVISKLEGPVHMSVLTSRLINAVGLNRAGKRIQTRVLECVSELKCEGALEFDGTFLKHTDIASIGLRDWSNLPPNQRKFEYVSQAELSEALFITVKDAHSVDREDCMSAALSLIGFKRLTGSIQSLLDNVLDGLIAEGRLHEKSGRLQVSG